MGNPIDITDSASSCSACFGSGGPWGEFTPKVMWLFISGCYYANDPPPVPPLPPLPNGAYVCEQSLTPCTWVWTDFEVVVTISLIGGKTMVAFQWNPSSKQYYYSEQDGCKGNGENQVQVYPVRGGFHRIGFSPL